MKKKRSGKKTPRLGQHFLTSLWAARTLAEAIKVREDETILEIGPGKGALTSELLATGAKVIAVEKDRALIDALHDRFRTSIVEKQLVLLEGDVRDFDPRNSKLKARSYVVAANIPYYITGEIVRKFLTADPQPRAMALLVQKEVAERITNKEQKTVNRKKGKESILSISVKAYGTPKMVARVSRGNFSPPPLVDSAIILIDGISRDFFSDIDEETFFRVVKAGFASKRKLLAGNLSSKFGFRKPEIAAVLAKCDIREMARAEDLQLEKWKCLAIQLTVNRSL